MCAVRMSGKAAKIGNGGNRGRGRGGGSGPGRGSSRRRGNVASHAGRSAETAPYLDEVAGVALCASGLLLAVASYFQAAGAAGRYIDLGLAWLLGTGRYLLPVALAAWGALLVSGRSPRAGSVGIGLSMSLLAMVSLIHLRISPASHWDPVLIGSYGGLLGAAFSFLLRAAFGVIGAAIVLVTTLIIGLVLATGVSIAESIRTVADGIRARAAHGGSAAATDAAGVAGEIAAESPEIAGPPLFELQAPSAPADSARFGPMPEADRDAGIRDKTTGEAGSLEHTGPYRLPPLDLLRRTTSRGLKGSKSSKENAQILERTLREFDVDASVNRVVKGPTVTRFELELGSGVKVNRVLSLADDIALALATADVRIVTPIPGKSAIGVEVPNLHRDLVTLGDILATPEAGRVTGLLTVGIGKDIAGQPVLANIGDMPHLLIAGATGSGKSVCINSVLVSVLMRARPDQVKMILIDPKRIELNLYAHVPHLLTPVVTNPKQAATVLAWAVSEMEDRFKLLSEVGARNVDGYNSLARDKVPEPLPYVLIVIDELADLMMVAPGEVEDAVCRIAQLARAVGIHLVVATQRPSVDIITGLIKANITSRIAFAVSSQTDSRVILDGAGAEKLVGKGDLLFSTPTRSRPQRIQGSFLNEQEIELVTSFCRRQGRPQYRAEVLEDQRSAFGLDFDDPLLDDAMEVVVTAGQASVSMLQRRLRVGYARAARLIDMLEARGIVGAHDGSRPRAVLMTLEELGVARRNRAEEG